MRLRHAFLGSASAVVLALGLAALPARADDQAPPPLPSGALCKNNPGKCQAAREKHEQWCKDNPKQCEHWKQKRTEREQFCKNNPKKCEEQRAEMKKRKQEMQAECAKDPAKCEQMKQQARERMQERHGKGTGETPAKKVAPEAPAEPSAPTP
jgi:hypothetical protein